MRDITRLVRLNKPRSIFQTRRHTISGRRLRTDSECSQKSLRSGKRNQPNKDPQRPFYRDDIFYGGSLNRLPHYKSQVTLISRTFLERESTDHPAILTVAVTQVSIV